MGKDYKKRSYRVFISYRGGDNISSKFAAALYKAIINTPNSRDYFGNVYFSPSNPVGNFKDDIPHIMKDVEYFIIPYYKGFFDGFLNRDGSLNEESITRLEIQEALKNKCKYFVPVYLDGTTMDPLEVNSIFGDKCSRIMCGNQHHIKMELYDPLADIVDCVYRAIKIKTKIFRNNSDDCNLHMVFKGKTEDSNTSIYHNLHGAKRITLLNIAGTSFIAGDKIADIYRESDYVKRWFYSRLSNGSVSADIIIINPDSNAAKDAIKYKIFPEMLILKKNEIIRKNYEEILQVKESYQNGNIRVFLTDIALPYGVMRASFNDSSDDYMKVDLYAPLIVNDKKRPSFYLEQKDEKTIALYDFFSDNIDALRNDAKEVTRNLKPTWLCDSNIVHRAMIDSECKAHTRSALEKCILQGTSIEVDLLQLRDGTVIVWRDEEVNVNGNRMQISSMNIDCFEKYRSESHKRGEIHGEILTLQELFDLNLLLSSDNNQKPSKLLLEIKYYKFPKKGSEGYGKLLKYIKNITDILEKYKGIYAIHSSNPLVLKAIKAWKRSVLVGQIVFDGSKDATLSKKTRKIQNKGKWKDIIKVDFVSCRVGDESELAVFTYAYKHNIPVIGWVVKVKENETDEEIRNRLQLPFDSLIIEKTMPDNI